jgi:predicted methyltransferase
MDSLKKCGSMYFSVVEDYRSSLMTRATQPTIEQVIALELATMPQTTTIGERISQILKEVRRALNDPLRTLSSVKKVILSWANHGWVKLTNNYVSLTEHGNGVINAIARAAIA